MDQSVIIGNEFDGEVVGIEGDRAIAALISPQLRYADGLNSCAIYVYGSNKGVKVRTASDLDDD